MFFRADTRSRPSAALDDLPATLAGVDPPIASPGEHAAFFKFRRVAGLSLAAFIVVALPFAYFNGLILYHFYVKGGVFWDSGLLASLIWHSDSRLTTPPLFGGESFFATHVTPIFLLISLISRLVPASMAQFFAGFSGLCHALPAVGVFWLLVGGHHWRTPRAMAAAALIGIAFSFNGLALAIARYPHFEMLIVGTFILFAVALVQRQMVVAGTCFVLCLATREDAGFHVFAVLSVLIALNRWRDVPWHEQQPELAFATLGLLYSLCALGVQSFVFPHHSSFGRIYVGHPAFAGLTAERIGERLLGYFAYRTYIVLPAIITICWSVLSRNPYLLVGYAAFVPWAVLHLLADSSIAGTLSGYYAYPFMIASFWPLLGALIDRPRAVSRFGSSSVIGFLLMIAASFTALSGQYNPADIDLREGFLSPPSLLRQRATTHAIDAFVRSRSALGKILVDGSILALAPNAFGPGDTVAKPRDGHPDTVIYFAHGYEAARAAASAAGLTGHYRVPGTSIRVATDRPLTESPALAALLRPTGAAE